MICVPMAKPGITAAVLLGVVEYWNMIEQPMLFLKTPSLKPFSLVMPGLSPENLPYAFAFAFFVMMPVVLLTVRGREELEKGIGTMVGKE